MSAIAYVFLGVFILWLHMRVRRLERPPTDTEPPERPPTGKRPRFIPAAPPGPDPYGYRCRGCDTLQDTRAVHRCPAMPEGNYKELTGEEWRERFGGKAP